MKGFLKELYAGRWFAASPIVVLHPRVSPEGGFTQIEVRALRNLDFGSGGQVLGDQPL